MLTWIKRYWPALILGALVVVLFDAVISSLITCHPIGTDTGHGANPAEQQKCSTVAGPLLLSLMALVSFLDNHGEAVTGIFTFVLAIFTGRLWFSTEKLWKVSNASTKIAEIAILDLERAFVIPAFPNPVKADEKEWNVLIALMNVGRSYGIVHSLSVRFSEPNALPTVPPDDGYEERLTDTVLRANSKKFDGILPFTMPSKIEGQIIYGYVLYEDVFYRNVAQSLRCGCLELRTAGTAFLPNCRRLRLQSRDLGTGSPK